MTKTITTDKTILVLAFAVTFLAGAAVFGSISDYEAEAKPKPKCPPDCPSLPPILKPMNVTLFEIQAQMDDMQDELDAINAKQDVLSVDLSVIDDGVNDIKSAQVVSKNILCGIATSPTGCLP